MYNKKLLYASTANKIGHIYHVLFLAEISIFDFSCNMICKYSNFRNPIVRKNRVGKLRRNFLLKTLFSVEI
ncbi:MAG: hypothetical protein CVU11_13590 [Bacteroidetes bacterium HGW-Bacteroidetes-6]|nr:MAG: hypothetical protein CVU11_13590 [Bacteroidetes bacterium HGW-Bacteroidetes-6]